MRFAGFALFVVCAWWPVVAAAQDAAESERIADTMVRLCVGGGRTEATSGTGTGGADLSLRSLDVKGNVKGEFKISKSSAEGLVNGLDNALGQVAADQADKVRACLQPVRERLLDIMLPAKKQGSAGQTMTAPGGVAVGGDVKNSPITITTATPPPATPPSALHADCSDEFMKATVIPSEGRIYFLALQPIPAEGGGGGGLGQTFAEGGKIKWPTPPNSIFPLHGYRCQITNYGNAPVFNVSIALHEVFKKAIHEDGRNGSGEVTLAREWPIPIGKIDIGATNPFTFYIYNQSDKYVFVSMPELVALQRGGEGTTQEVHLIHPPSLMMYFMPELFP